MYLYFLDIIFENSTNNFKYKSNKSRWSLYLKDILCYRRCLWSADKTLMGQ